MHGGSGNEALRTGVSGTVLGAGLAVLGRGGPGAPRPRGSLQSVSLGHLVSSGPRKARAEEFSGETGDLCF